MNPPTAAVVASRFGLKGPQAKRWLEQQGFAVPDAPNRIARWNGGRCLRLGHGEFLVERDHDASRPTDTTDGAWLLLRSDFSVVLDGPTWPRQLAELCAFDFQRLHAEPDLVVMTLLAGISVTLVREPRPDDAPNFALRLWCDASYATYLMHCLQHPGETP
jgi:sarcosine oxidase subunit gamma